MELDSRLGHRQQRNSAGMSELEGTLWMFGKKDVLDSHRVEVMGVDLSHEPLMDFEKTLVKRCFGARNDHARIHVMEQSIANGENPPSGLSSARIDPENVHC